MGALRHETRWETVASAITSSQLRGEVTFRQACDELRFRCEATRVYEVIDKQVVNKRKVQGYSAKVLAEEAPDVAPVDDEVKAFISSMSKRLNKPGEQHSGKTDIKKAGGKPKKVYEKRECLAKDCNAQSTFPLCGIHYHSLVSGKSSVVELKNDWGNATFNQWGDSDHGVSP